MYSHHVYKSVVTSNRTIRPGEGTCWPIHTMNLQWHAVTKDSQIMGYILSEKNIHRLHDILLHKGTLLSVILLGEGTKEKA